MAEDWAADVKRYVADADDEVIGGIVRYCGIALRKRDSSLVSFKDATETGRVRENFLRKKLGLTHPDSDLDAAIAAIGERMKGDNFKNRVTAYYLLSDHFDQHHQFRKGAAARPASAPVAIADATGAATVAAAAGAAAGAAPAAKRRTKASPSAVTQLAPMPLKSAEPGAAAPSAAPVSRPAAPVATAPAAGTVAAAASGAVAAGAGGGARSFVFQDLPEHPYRPGGDRGGSGWLLWLGLIIGLLALVFLFRMLGGKPDDASAAAPTEAAAAVAPAAAPSSEPAAPANDLSAAPAEGTVAIPQGAGVTSELRDGKPVVKVYFDTGKTDVVPAFGEAAGGLKAYLASHSGSTLAISGYNDPSGNAAANAELSKNRAQAVRAALVAAGIAEGATELVKPEAATDAQADAASARRVEVVVR